MIEGVDCSLDDAVFVQVSLRMKHDYRNIISAAASTGDRSAASPTDNIVWLEHLVYINLSVH